jgi:hypothetical protein
MGLVSLSRPKEEVSKKDKPTLPKLMTTIPKPTATEPRSPSPSTPGFCWAQAAGGSPIREQENLVTPTGPKAPNASPASANTKDAASAKYGSGRLGGTKLNFEGSRADTDKDWRAGNKKVVSEPFIGPMNVSPLDINTSVNRLTDSSSKSPNSCSSPPMVPLKMSSSRDLRSRARRKKDMVVGVETALNHSMK